MAGKAARRMPVRVRVPIVITLVLAGVLASSSVWGLTGTDGGHGGAPGGVGEHGSSSVQPTDRTHGGDSSSEGADHGPGRGAGRGNHGLGSEGTSTLTATTTL